MKTLRQDHSEFNCIFVHSALDDLGLDPYEFRIYAHLARRANSKNKAWPGLKSMAEACRMNRHTIIRAIQHLEERNLIRVIRKSGGLNEYLLTAPSEWKEPSSAKTGTGAQNNTGTVSSTRAVPKTALPPVSKEALKGNPYEGYPLKDNTGKGSPTARRASSMRSDAPLLNVNGGSPNGEPAMNDKGHDFQVSEPSQSPIVRKAYAVAELLCFKHWDNCKVSFTKQTARAYAEKALKDGHDEQVILKAYETALGYCHRLVTDEINRRERLQYENASPALTVWLARERLNGDPLTIEERWENIISKLTAQKRNAIEEELKIQSEIAEKSPAINDWFKSRLSLKDHSSNNGKLVST